MYTEVSERQQDSAWKNSQPKCFKTKDFARILTDPSRSVLSMCAEINTSFVLIFLENTLTKPKWWSVQKFLSENFEKLVANIFYNCFRCV